MSEPHGEWRSLVAHSAGGRAVAGSNPVSPIISSLPRVSPGALSAVLPSRSALEDPKDRSVGLLRSLELGDVAAFELEVAGGRKRALDVLPEGERHQLVSAAPDEESLA